MSRQELLDHVWGLDDEPASNVVEVYIRYLRQKIDAPFLERGEPALLATVRGAGYRLVSDEETR